MAQDEIETARLAVVADIGIDGPIDEFHVHEALHVSSLVMNLVERELMEAPAIAADPDWFRRVYSIREALFDLYQTIGAHEAEEAK